MPTGVVATLGKYIPMQNARMLQMLLAKHGGIYILPDDFEKLPLYLQLGCIPVMSGMPPFGYWEKREEGSRIPPHRTDAGVFLSAEFLGARRAIFIKDEDGLYTDDPKKNPTATHIPRITAKELIERDLPDVVVERVVIEYLPRARWCKELQIVNGLKPGQVLARARGRGCRDDHLRVASSLARRARGRRVQDAAEEAGGRSGAGQGARDARWSQNIAGAAGRARRARRPTTSACPTMTLRDAAPARRRARRPSRSAARGLDQPARARRAGGRTLSTRAPTTTATPPRRGRVLARAGLRRLPRRHGQRADGARRQGAQDRHGRRARDPVRRDGLPDVRRGLRLPERQAKSDVAIAKSDRGDHRSRRSPRRCATIWPRST